MRKTDQHTFFFTERDAFSNWHVAPFSFRGIEFNCVEQFMMLVSHPAFATFGSIPESSKEEQELD